MMSKGNEHEKNKLNLKLEMNYWSRRNAQLPSIASLKTT